MFYHVDPAHRPRDGPAPGESGNRARPPLHSALVRYWVRQRALRLPVPLTGARALRADVSWHDNATWPAIFLAALADEADDALDLLSALERAWFAVCRAVAGRRRHPRAAAAIDVMAAAPLISATSLAVGLGMAVKNAAALLEDFRSAGITVEITHRSKRRLFGLAGLAPLRDVVCPPERPDPTRGRGRRRLDRPGIAADIIQPSIPSAPLDPVERRQFDFSDLERWMAQMDQTIRHARLTLSALAPSKHPGAE